MTREVDHPALDPEPPQRFLSPDEVQMHRMTLEVAAAEVEREDEPVARWVERLDWLMSRLGRLAVVLWVVIIVWAATRGGGS